MIFNSYSQAGQDQWIHDLFKGVHGDGYKGTFLDIGCCEPRDLSNTYALEQLGWTGWLVDRSDVAVVMCLKERQSPVFLLDMSIPQPKFWVTVPPVIDYASIDIDEGTLAALESIPWGLQKFKAMTVEHDAYRFGDERRQSIRSLLESKGYIRRHSDVEHSGMAFEDWWVLPEFWPSTK